MTTIQQNPLHETFVEIGTQAAAADVCWREELATPQKTSSLESWIPWAVKLLGYDVIENSPRRPLLDAHERWESRLSVLGYSEHLSDMLRPWRDEAMEDAEAFAPIAGEHWPAE